MADEPQSREDEVQTGTGLASGITGTLSAWARECGVHHITLGKRLASAGVAPSGKSGPWAVYRARDLFKLYQRDAEEDPDKLPAIERKAWYEGERRKRELQVRDGGLVPVEEVRAAMARLARVMIDATVTLPDLLEREVGLSAEDVERIEERLDRLRADIAAQLEEAES